MSDWGKTGRVTLDGEVLPWVLVDGESVGWVYTPDDDYSGWGPRTKDGYFDEHLPTLDAAVLWVLRRVDPALWRQERGEVGTLQIADDVWFLRTPGHPAWTLPRGAWTFAEAISALDYDTRAALAVAP